ncbi:MAG: hypothetical protein ABIP51_10130 [Bacteroidia bacterium]
MICIIIFGCLCSCGDSGMSEFDNINTWDAIKGMFNNQAAQAKKDGLVSKLKYDAHALEGFWIVDGTLIEDDSLKKIYTNWDKQNKIVDYKLEDVHVFPINMTSATYHYLIEIVYLDSSKTEKTLRQLESGVVTKTDNIWYYLNGNTSNIHQNK